MTKLPHLVILSSVRLLLLSHLHQVICSRRISSSCHLVILSSCHLVIDRPALALPPASGYMFPPDKGGNGRPRKHGGEEMRVLVSRTRLLLVVGFLGVTATTVFWGRNGSLSEATANPPGPGQAAPQPNPRNPPAAAANSSDYSHRVVAYIYDTIPITREEL